MGYENSIILFCVILFPSHSIFARAALQKPPLSSEKVLLLTLVREVENDGIEQQLESAKKFGIEAETVRVSKEQYDSGSRFKPLLEALQPYKDDGSRIVVIINSNLTVMNAKASRLHEAMSSVEPGDIRVLMSASTDSRLAATLQQQSQDDVDEAADYLSDAGLVAYADTLHQLLSEADYNAQDSFSFVRRLYTDSKLRMKYKIALDLKMDIFFTLIDNNNLNISSETLATVFEQTADLTVRPCIVQGIPEAAIVFHHYANYVGNLWNSTVPTVACSKRTPSSTMTGIEKPVQQESCEKLDEFDDTETIPQVTMVILIAEPTPFMEEFFEYVGNLSYPPKHLRVIVYSLVKDHKEQIDTFVNRQASVYGHLQVFNSAVDETTARNQALKQCEQCDYLFLLEGKVHLYNADTIQLLQKANKKFVTPMISKWNSKWATFWGRLSPSGFYDEYDDFDDMINGENKGLWNVPYVREVMLISAKLLPIIQQAFSYNPDLDPDMSFCQFCRDEGIFMYVDNRHFYGHMIDNKNYHSDKLFPELFETITNRHEWERRYIPQKLLKLLKDNDMSKVDMPCPDVFDFPLFTERFCWELIAEMEHFGQWSGGTNEDKRIEGGYENVPTRDIHMNQVGLDEQMYYILNRYVRAMQELVYHGFYKNPIKTHMMFVVRFRPDEQPSLRPHHDASTYSIDVALNRRGIDFEGGGVRFVRQNCSVLDHKQGGSLIFPGRLTHFHEGLEVTKGTRYIFVSFINP